MKLVSLLSVALVLPLAAQRPVSIFDGKTLKGWNVRKGEEKYWSVRDGMIVGGDLKKKVPRNTFLATDKSYQNFEMEFDIRLVKGSGFMNSGIQVRSIRLKNSHEMKGYQVDAGIGWWGKMYDESRRNRTIANPIDPAATKKNTKDWDWNHYRILCEGTRIRSWINGVPALDYTEKDPKIPLNGYIGFQAHGGGAFEVQFKNITIKELPATPGTPSWPSLAGKSWREQKRREKEAQMKITKTPSSPAKEMSGFLLPEGFTAELVASEAQGVGKPITVAWDTDGRMWTMTAYEYPVDANENKASAEALYQRGGKDKVLVFDTPCASGVQTPREFANGLVIPLGLAPYKGGAIVQYGKDVRYYYDKNKDGKADGYDVILTGFGIQDSHLFPHQFERTPGGWFYLAQGLFNYSRVVRPNGKPFADGEKMKVFNQCKLARFRPDGSGFQLLTSGPNNIWGLSQTRDGRVFLQEANDLGIPVAEFEPGTHYRTGSKEKLRPYAPQIPSMMRGQAMGGTGLSGLALVEDEGSPFQMGLSGEVFVVVNPITSKLQIINAVKNPKGQYLYQKQNDFMLSKDKWFRPIAAHFGPDGCLYVVDWYNKIISHNEVPRSHPDRDKTRGRIWRIRHKSQKPVTPPQLTKLSSKEVVNYLGSNNARVARLSWHELADRKDASVVPQLEKILLDSSASVARRCGALWSLEGMGQLKPSTLVQLAKSKEVSLRYESIRAAGEASLGESDLVQIANHAKFTEHRRTRVAMANAVRYHKKPTPTMMALVAQLGDPPLPRNADVSDRYDRDFQRYLARWALESHPEATTQMLGSEAASSLKGEHFLLAVQGLPPAKAAAQFIKVIPKLKRAISPAELSLLGSQLGNAEVKDGLRQILADPTRQRVILVTFEKLDPKLAADPSLAKLVEDSCIQLVKNQPSQENQALLVRLAAKFRIKSLESPVKKWLEQASRKDEEKVLGLNALREMKSQDQALFASFYQKGNASVKRAALAALAQLDTADVVAFFAKLWDSLPSDHRQIAVAGLTSNKKKANDFAAAAAARQFKGLNAESINNVISVLGANHPHVKSILKNTPGLLAPVIRLTGDKDGLVSTNIQLKGAFTIEAWVKLDPRIGAEDSLLGNRNGGADINFYGGHLRFYAGRRHGDRIVAKRKMQANVWTHCAITRDASGKFKIYLDADLDSQGGNALKADFNGLNIGGSNHPGGSGMSVRELRVWSYERSAQQILADFLTEYTEEARPKRLLHRVSGNSAGLKFSGKATAELTSDFPKLITPAEALAAKNKFNKFLAMAEKKGDAAKGKLLFATCNACHKVGDVGGAIGPDLSGAGAMSTEALLHNILTPNAKMESGYYTHNITLKDGSNVSGALVEETKKNLSIQPLAGNIKVIKKSNIAKHTISKTSLMPAGLIDAYTPEQVANLFSYLRSLK